MMSYLPAAMLAAIFLLTARASPRGVGRPAGPPVARKPRYMPHAGGAYLPHTYPVTGARRVRLTPTWARPSRRRADTAGRLPSRVGWMGNGHVGWRVVRGV